MAHDVFISYASEDKAVADRICETLEKSGIPCWIAPRNIEAGTEYPAAIMEGINVARVFVLVLSEHTAPSPHVLSEIGAAFNDRKRIIPFRLSTQPLPEDFEYFLSMTQWLDAPDGCTEQNLKRLLDAARDALAGKPATHEKVAPKRNWKWAAAIVPVLAVAAAVVTWKASKPPAKVLPAPAAAVSSPAPAPVPAPTTPPPVVPPTLETWLNPKDGQKYVWIKPGKFTMGCSAADSECEDNEKPTHPVAIRQGFWLAQTEVTIAAYGKYAAAHHAKAPAGNPNLPMTRVDWHGAKQYCAAIGGRLPTEPEWEYAARGGVAEAYYDVLSDIAWYAANSNDAAHPVGLKAPNAFGLYDMLGNVKEWVLDRYYNKYYLDSPVTADKVDQPLAGNATAVARGGSWYSEAPTLRASQRFEEEPDEADPTLGFRCVAVRP